MKKFYILVYTNVNPFPDGNLILPVVAFPKKGVSKPETLNNKSYGTCCTWGRHTILKLKLSYDVT